MTQPVIFQFWNAQFRHQAVVVIAVCTWLCWTLIIGQYIKIIIDYLFQWLYHSQQLLAHRNFTVGVLGFWCVDDKFRVLLQKSVGDQEFLLSSTLSKYDLQKAEERGRAAREIATMIAQNPSAVQREIFAGKAADVLGVSKSALLDDIRHERSKA